MRDASGAASIFGGARRSQGKGLICLSNAMASVLFHPAWPTGFRKGTARFSFVAQLTDFSRSPRTGRPLCSIAGPNPRGSVPVAATDGIADARGVAAVDCPRDANCGKPRTVRWRRFNSKPAWTRRTASAILRCVEWELHRTVMEQRPWCRNCRAGAPAAQFITNVALTQ